MISRRRFLRLTAATAGAGVIGAADAFAVEPRFRLVVKEWTVEHADWPAAAPPLRIGILTDIHAVEPWMSARRIGSIVDQLNAEEPDMIVLLGDYVNASQAEILHSQGARAGMGRPASVASCPAWRLRGSRKSRLVVWRNPRHPACLRKAGIPLLDNTAVKVTRGPEHFWIAGLSISWPPRARASAT